MSFSRQQIEAAIKHLRTRDPVMRELIRRVGPFTLRPERDRFRMLVRSIISQQISTQAARSIRERLDAVLAPNKLTPDNLARLTMAELRSAGLSPQKAEYLRDLCSRVLDGRLRLSQIGRRSDEKVVEQLVQVKGVGVWTAQMFLMFSLGRLDVFPHTDLGIRAALRDLYGLDDLPDTQTSREIARPWRPYATVACWYCWRNGDLQRNATTYAAGYPV